MPQPIVFTDLDGTLLDAADYSFAKARPALKLLRREEIPLVLCSSKTRSEIEYYRRLLDNRHPFISENGGGIFIPEGYFGPDPLPGDLPIFLEGEYAVLRLGAPYELLRRALAELRTEGFDVTGFGDLSPGEVARLTGLDPGQAAMAREREFDEPFLFSGGDRERSALLAAINAKGFDFTRGRLCHILGGSDKGRAVAILASLYREQYGAVVTVALGDSPNDLPMLQRVDYPVAVRQPDGRHDPGLDVPRLIRTEGVGPEGWREAILRLIPEISATTAPTNP